MWSFDKALEYAKDNVDKRPAGTGRLAGKIAVVTGSAQGFGEGIARELYREGASVVIADRNRELGDKVARGLGGHAMSVYADVSDEESVKEMVAASVEAFGGLDLLISNAGVLRAGGLEEIDLATFEWMTKINYTGYYLCAKYAAAVMKAQFAANPTRFADIIQINSKSGIAGSKNNFTYSGAKFGGIGLTQSIALELIPYNIKVNSICPGNYYEGPLWSDPENGLFVQYFKAGKVPGAKSIEDVRAYYLSRSPIARGCTPLDVAKAIFYCVEQTYETGQAIPVTGGQNMLK